MFTTEVHAALVRHVATETITTRSVADAWHRWFDDERFDPDRPVLWDCRGHFIQASLSDLRHLDELTIATRQERRSEGARTAVLVSYSVAQAAVQQVPESGGFVARIEVFTDEAKAYRWLGLEPPAPDGPADAGLEGG